MHITVESIEDNDTESGDSSLSVNLNSASESNEHL